MSDNFNLEIISPDKKLLSDKVNLVIIPAFEGEMSILPNHISLITFLRPGIIQVNLSKKIDFFVEEGTVEFSNNSLVILSSTILELNKLSKEKISQMIEESKNKLKEENLDDKSRYIYSHKLDCLSRINV